jgi:5-formyltetrahydrofolate cyclo-ligase
MTSAFGIAPTATIIGGRRAPALPLRYHRSMASPFPHAAPSASGAALREAKRRVRELAQRARDALAAEARAAASRRIAAAMTALPSYATACTLLVVLPFRTEWNSRLVAAAALAAGKAVVAPRVNAATRMLTLHRVVDLDRDFAPGYRGIPEPRGGCPEAAPDTIEWALVPGIAFDARGRRLGYGGGYYDRLLPLLPRGATRVAGAFEVQIVPEVPVAPHDLAVDFIVTEARIIAVA